MFVEKVADKRAAHSMDKQGPSLTLPTTHQDQRTSRAWYSGIVSSLVYFQSSSVWHCLNIMMHVVYPPTAMLSVVPHALGPHAGLETLLKSTMGAVHSA